jgi:hypothetical protein
MAGRTSAVSIDSLEPIPLQVGDRIMTFSDDESEGLFAESWFGSARDHPEPGHRRRYGEGIEARRSAQYRHYDWHHSLIYQLLQHQQKIVTKVTLRDFIDDVIEATPENVRPKPPTRDQRRAKGGLVWWLDNHAAFVVQHLRWGAVISK